MNELPTMNSSTYTSNNTVVGSITPLTTNTVMYGNPEELNDARKFLRDIEKHAIKKENNLEKKIMRRLIQVFIVDPDPKMPLNDSLIYQGDVMLTDATDEELFFDIPIKELLQSHNEKREKVIDKKSKTDRTLDPIRIRDLNMTVVELATF